MNSTKNLREEICEVFALTVGRSGLYKLESQKNNAFVIRNTDQKTFGIAIALPKEVKGVDEYYSNVHFYTDFLIADQNERFLILDSSYEYGREEFALVCESLLKEDAENQLVNPMDWWNRWKHLIGNAEKNNNPYDVIGEMLVLQYLIEQNHTGISWNGQDKPSTHDFTTDDSEHEVKSTVVRAGNDVHISSQYQLCTNNNLPLFLYFCRFEKSDQGPYSINSMKKKLMELGVDGEEIEDRLSKRGLRRNSSEREDSKYDLLEMRQYEVDCDFPRITEKSFVSQDVLNGIKSFEYTIDLSNLKSKNLK